MLISRSTFDHAVHAARQQGIDTVLSGTSLYSTQREKNLETKVFDLNRLLTDRRDSAAKYSAATREQIGGLENKLKSVIAECTLLKLMVNSMSQRGAEAEITYLEGRVKDLTDERLVLRNTVNGLSDQLGMAEEVLKLNPGVVWDVNSLYPSPVTTIFGTMSGKDFNNFSDMEQKKLTTPPAESYCVMKCVRKLGSPFTRRTPITSDVTIAEAIELCNGANMDHASDLEHYEIQVF